MASGLEPCAGCGRHVRRDARACPFCDAALCFDAIPARVMPTTRLCRSALMSFGAVAAVTAGCGALDHTTNDADVSMDARASMDAPASADALDDPNCYGPDTGYGTPPFGWCCNTDCCHGPRNWFACPDPYPDAGDAAPSRDGADGDQ